MPKSSPKQLHYKTIAVIGLGQVGGSIVKRLSVLRPKTELLAHDRDRRLADKVARHAEWVTGLGEIVRRSNIIIIATPVPAIITLFGEIAKLSGVRSEKLLVLDTGTVKQAIEIGATKHTKFFDHVGLHPLAGAEGEGWDTSRADLFLGKSIVVAPAAKSRLPVVKGLISALGATAKPMDTKTHDRFVAESIGLPHLLAFAAQGMSKENPLRAGSWASLTRVAASNPEMVAGFLGANAVEQKKTIARFEKELKSLKHALTTKSLLKLLAARQRAND